MFIVAALYHFTRFDDPDALRPGLRKVCEDGGVRGTLLLAPEGINGTIAGPRDGIDAALHAIKGLPDCSDLEWKESESVEMPFSKLKVRLKREIVTMHQPQVDPTGAVGHYVDPSDWNELISAEDVAVIDTRNDYEVEIGTFENAVDPVTKSFGEFPAWWEENKSRFHNKRIAMFCTGGIRCEKSTNYHIGLGLEEVYHLKGGILKYLETVPEENSLWNGQCFVFDRRVSVGHGLKQGDYDLCHACRRPISDLDKTRPEYEGGVACHRCVDEYTASDRERFRERQRQITLARARGQEHLS